MEALTISEGQSGKCANPLCRAELPESSRKPKRFCCDPCKMDGWVLKQAAKLLAPLGRVKAVSVLREVSNGRF